MEALKVANDTEHVLALAHVLHKDALERRLVLVELSPPPPTSYLCQKRVVRWIAVVTVCG